MQLIQVVLLCQIAKYQSITMLDPTNPYKSRQIIAAHFLILSEPLHVKHDQAGIDMVSSEQTAENPEYCR